MNITDALEALGSGEFSPADRQSLDDHGYLVLRDVIDEAWLEQLRDRVEALWEAEGPGTGYEVHLEEGTLRLADLVNKGEAFDRVYTEPRLLQAVYQVIGRDFKLSSLNARDPLFGQGHRAFRWNSGEPMKWANKCAIKWSIPFLCHD